MKYSLACRIKHSRFRLLSEPLSTIGPNEEIWQPAFPFSEEVRKIEYPVRALRFWWMHCLIREELGRIGRVVIIADIGCDRGIIKLFAPPAKNAYWIGLDIDTNREGIHLAKYDELHPCDLNEGIPLADWSVDVAVCSHVLEYLPRPGFLMSEMERILRPGGMLLVSVPVVPKFISHFRKWQCAEHFKSGKRKSGQLIHTFSVSRLRRLAKRAGLEVKLLTGTSVIGKSGSRLENYAFWIRLNQMSAALFPSLGRELCVQIRKPA